MGDGHVGEDQDEAPEPRLSAQSLPVDQDAGRELTLWSSSPCEDLDEAAELRPCAPEHQDERADEPQPPLLEDEDQGASLGPCAPSPPSQHEDAELRPCAQCPSEDGHVGEDQDEAPEPRLSAQSLPEDQDERADEPQPPLCLAEDEEVAAEL